MRLLNTYTGEFRDFPNHSEIPLYAILSHTWDPNGEQSYQDVRRIQDTYKISAASIWEQRWGLSAKIRKACEMARNDGYDFIWIDSSCIDKTSSSELQEAINSMYPWYGSAHTCYAFLSDVPSSTHVKVKGSAFRESRWFKRGWTLQELIAPPWIVFLSSEWKVLGTKDGLVDVIHEITLISRRILRHEDSLDTASIAQRMSWAAGRQTTRVEDQAYSLQGLLGINMHTLYGEGEQAFRRLQEEILTRYPDQSILAWGTV
ncbi:HET-domain-containing protein, partial [Dichomitus squalens LYAD-421 SS1]